MLGLAAAIGAASGANAGEWGLIGYVAPEVRVFPYGPAFAGQDGRVAWPSIAVEPEITYEWNNGNDRLTVTPFGRYDAFDSNRSHFDLREANWLHIGDGWDVVVGAHEVFWGVAESRHLVNIVNQNDQVEDIDEEDKLGQPMVNLNLTGDWGELGVFVMPYFRERRFHSPDARLRGPVPVNDDLVTFESDLGRMHPDVAIRYTTSGNGWGQWDLGLHYFHGTSREPRLLPAGPVLAPFYEIIDQTGIDLLAIYDDLQVKLEMIGRFGQGSPFMAVVGGAEYTFFDVAGTGIDVGALLEYNYDGRDAAAPTTALDSAIFFGTRLTFNNTQDTNILAGAAIDTGSGATFASIEAFHRLFDNWRIEAEGRFFANVSSTDPLAALAQDDFLQFRLVWFY